MVRKPSLFAAAMKDCICTALRGRATMAEFATDVTTVEFDTGHWVHLEATEQVNYEMEK